MPKIVSEHAEQVALVTRCHKEGIFVASFCNGFYISNKQELYTQLMKLKQEGLLKGMPDLVVVLENKIIFIEMKNKIGQLSKEQIHIHYLLKELGHDIQVFYDAKSAWSYIDEQRNK